MRGLNKFAAAASGVSECLPLGGGNSLAKTVRRKSLFLNGQGSKERSTLTQNSRPDTLTYCFCGYWGNTLPLWKKPGKIRQGWKYPKGRLFWGWLGLPLEFLFPGRNENSFFSIEHHGSTWKYKGQRIRSVVEPPGLFAQARCFYNSCFLSHCSHRVGKMWSAQWEQKLRAFDRLGDRQGSHLMSSCRSP